MPQNINLNVSPYYDDFDKDKNYHRVLFKPGTNVQARELTTLQTILQNQIESFGRHFFKDGAMIIPGNIGYDPEYDCVEINGVHLGIPVEEYLTQLVGKRIKGQTSNIVAKIENVITEAQSERKNPTLYIKYKSSSQSNFINNKFLDGENLLLLEDVEYSLGLLEADNTFATTILNNSTSTGSAVKIDSGVFFIRGFFLDIKEQTLILDQYDNNPSYRVGLLIKESFATASNEFNDLLDNSQGYYNFAAPGADRLLIQTELIKKPLDDLDDENFVQLLKVEDGVLDSIVDTTEYNKLLDELARRTYDESGDYYVKPFGLEVKESLDDNLGNNGIYEEGEITKNGNIPTDDLACLIVSPGKAYVRGYEVEKINNTILDFNKSRDTDTSTNESIQFNFGTKIELNNVSGFIPVGFTTDSYVNLHNNRTLNPGVSAGLKIGVARLYDLKLKSSEYLDSSSIFEASLYDIQTYTKLAISSGFSTSYSESTFIEGRNSGANGFLVSNITTSTKEFNLYQTSGSFQLNEPLIVNGLETNRIVKEITNYSLNDVNQLVSYNAGISTFTADTVLSRKIDFSNQKDSYIITQNVAGVSTVITSNDNFYSNVKVDDYLEYTKQNDKLITYNRVSKVDKDNLIVEIKSSPSTTGVNEGSLPTNEESVSIIRKVTLDIANNNEKLYSNLNNKNISSLDLSNSRITFRKTLNILITNSQVFEVSVFEGSTDSVLVPFDEEAYTLTYENGEIETLSSRKLSPNVDSSRNPAQGRITLRNLKYTGNAYLTITYEKVDCKTRNKTYNRCKVISIPYTNTERNTRNTGLTLSTRYGTRIEDREISLNFPEVDKIIGIFESNDANDADLPAVTLSSNVSNLIKGEKIIGQDSKAVAIYINSISANTVEFCYLNNKEFNLNEEVIFEESESNSTVSSISIGDKNITDSYQLDSGSKLSYLDYSRIVRTSGVNVPTRRLKIVYNYYSIDSQDTGSFVGVNSYEQENYKILPTIGEERYSDILDFRPRVAEYDVDNSILSPFDFKSRIFDSGNSSSESIVAQDSATTLSYQYYLPRIDKLFITKNGDFTLSYGVPALSPKEPQNIKNSLEVAKIYNPAYVYNVDDIKIKLRNHKRYQMKDISKLDDRLTKVEKTTSLSLLELDTKMMNIIDPNTSLSRFKSGFFVDDFTTTNRGDITNSAYKVEIDTENNLMRPEYANSYVDLLLDETNSSNIKIKGNIACLDYDEVEHLKNSFATRVENINPFNISTWVGTINLMPSKDSGIDFSKLNTTSDINISIEEDEENTLNDEISPINSNSLLRSRNIGVVANKLKPNTLYHSFFDDKNVKKYFTPKLIEIEMISGAFSVGENVLGEYNDSSIIFKVAKQNHKFGPYNNPDETYNFNPYNTNTKLASNYSSTSTILNVDIDSLSAKQDEDYYGFVVPNMILRGDTSGAVAEVKNVRLISDESGDLLGSLFIPNTQINSNPKFKSGIKTLVLTTNSNNLDIINLNESIAETNFISSPDLSQNDNSNEFVEELSTLKARGITSSPIAQSFIVSNREGIFITKCNIYFNTKDDNTPVSLHIRKVKNGTPSNEIIKYSEVILKSNEVTTSNTSLIPTSFEFKSPVYLEGENEYCIVLTSSSNEYTVWSSRMGEEDLTSLNSQTGNRVIVSQQPLIGSLFKSQNASVWEPNIQDDLKFTLYRAEFKASSGSISFNNPSSNSQYNLNQTYALNENSINAYSRIIKVKLSRVLTSSEVIGISSGFTITQENNEVFQGKAKAIVGPIPLNSTLEIVSPGLGYTSGITTYNNVDIVPITGVGTGAKARITTGVGTVTSVIVTTSGQDYSLGDTLTLDYRDTSDLGENVVLTIPSTTGIGTSLNTLILEDVQGSPTVSSGDIILNGQVLSGASVGEQPVVLEDGLHFKVHLPNHGMYSQNNFVKLSGIEPDVRPIKLLATVTSSSTELSVDNAINFITFEGRTVGVNTVGYLNINNEIMSYVGVNTTSTPNTITLGTRGIDSTKITTHFINDLVFKYEFNGISLRKINKEHSLATVNYDKYPLDIDNYHIKISSDNGKYFKTNKSSNKFISDQNKLNYPRSSYNISYNRLKPIVNITTLENTEVSAKVRTHTNTSINGDEVAFLDKGFERCSLTTFNTLNSMRAIFSRSNELEYVDTADNKSLTLQLNLQSSSSVVSPIIDLEQVGVSLTSNRINSPIDDYTTDFRVNSLLDDPSASIYISKKINIEKPADSLKVVFNAYRHASNDIRALYRLFNGENQEETQVFKLFPGYGNINRLGYTIDEEASNGLTDIKITPSSTSTDYKQYEYTVNTQSTFTGFQIKIILSGNNQAFVPKIKNLRVIATL